MQSPSMFSKTIEGEWAGYWILLSTYIGHYRNCSKDKT